MVDKREGREYPWGAYGSGKEQTRERHRLDKQGRVNVSFKILENFTWKVS